MLEYMGMCEIEVKPTELFLGLSEKPNLHSLQIIVSAVIILTDVLAGQMLASSIKGDIVSRIV